MREGGLSVVGKSSGWFLLRGMFNWSPLLFLLGLSRVVSRTPVQFRGRIRLPTYFPLLEWVSGKASADNLLLGGEA